MIQNLRLCNISDTVAKRFWDKFEPEPNTGCWLWTDSLDRHGYGQFTITPGFVVRSHRLSWVLTNGDIPGARGYHGLCVCHRCDVRCCINPQHLFLGSNYENRRDSAAKGRMARGERIGGAQLSDAAVGDIKARLRSGELLRVLAAEYRVHVVTISDIKRNKTWRHVP